MAKNMMHEFAVCGHLVFRCSTPLSQRCAQTSGRWKVFPYRPRRDPSTAEPLLKTIVAVSQLSIDGAAAIWYNSNSTEDSFDFNENCDISQRLTTNLTRHENPDSCDQAPRHRLQTVSERTSPVEFNSLAQGCREAGISKLVDRGTTLCDPTGCSSE